MHAKPGSAEVLMIRMYQIFTGNQIKTLRGEYSLDFTDATYQQSLPLHARNTASTAIKSNTRLTQFISDEDVTSGQILTLGALDQHSYWKERTKQENPLRYYADHKSKTGSMTIATTSRSLTLPPLTGSSIDAT